MAAARVAASRRSAVTATRAAARTLTVLMVDPRMDPIGRATLEAAGCTVVVAPSYADVETICAASGPHIDGMLVRSTYVQLADG
jgi:hypothetical protein